MVNGLVPAPKGTLYYQVEEHGRIYVVKNQIVSTYRSIQAAAMAGGGTITHFALGTDNTATDKAQTGLIQEEFRGRVTDIDSGSTTFTVRYRMPPSDGNGETYQEAGLFNASSGGVMYCRVVLSPAINKTSSIAPLFSWVITLSDS